MCVDRLTSWLAQESSLLVRLGGLGGEWAHLELSALRSSPAATSAPSLTQGSHAFPETKQQ